jgi:hypothetical protein
LGKKKKEIRIIKDDSNKEDYTFVSDNNILNHLQNESINNEKKSENKLDARIEKKFIQRK